MHSLLQLPSSLHYQVIDLFLGVGQGELFRVAHMHMNTPMQLLLGFVKRTRIGGAEICATDLHTSMQHPINDIVHSSHSI